MSVFFPVVVFLLASGTSLILTSQLRKVAVRIGLTDRPDSRRKLHRTAMPVSGGISVFLATVVTFGVLLVVPNPWKQGLCDAWLDLLILLLASLVIVVVGAIDDSVGLRGRHKLAGQILAASILMAGGLLIKSVGLFGWSINLGLLAVPVTLFWLVGAMNALNLMDGIDGLAAMLGIILAATICAIGMMTGHPSVSVIAFVFVGSLVGFLRFNFPPASVFLGDAGSMLIGLVVGMLAISGSLKGPGTVLLAAPLAVWAIPIFDSAAAILRRKFTGRSIYATDRSHMHHRFMDLLGSNHKVLGLIAILCAFTSAAALVSVFLNNDVVALATCAAIVVLCCITGVFGRAELLLLTSHLRRAGLSLVRPIGGRQDKVHQAVIRLQGSRQWELLWATLTESADKFHLTHIALDVDLPVVQEGYNAIWKRPVKHGDERCWHMELPLVVADYPVGFLTISGQRNGGTIYQTIEQLLDLLEPFELRLQTLAETETPAPDTDDDLSPVQTLASQGDPAVTWEQPG